MQYSNTLKSYHYIMTALAKISIIWYITPALTLVLKWHRRGVSLKVFDVIAHIKPLRKLYNKLQQYINIYCTQTLLELVGVERNKDDLQAITTVITVLIFEMKHGT